MRDAIADEIVRTHEFEVPESLVSGFLDAFVEDMQEPRRKNGPSRRASTRRRFREESRVHAVWQAKWMLLKEAIARGGGHHVSRTRSWRRSPQPRRSGSGIDKERLLAYYQRLPLRDRAAAVGQDDGVSRASRRRSRTSQEQGRRKPLNRHYRGSTQVKFEGKDTHAQTLVQSACPDGGGADRAGASGRTISSPAS